MSLLIEPILCINFLLKSLYAIGSALQLVWLKKKECGDSRENSSYGECSAINFCNVSFIHLAMKLTRKTADGIRQNTYMHRQT